MLAKNCLFTFKLGVFINKLHYQVKCWLSNHLYTDLVFQQVVPDVCPDSETQLCKDRMTFSLSRVLTLSLL